MCIRRARKESHSGGSYPSTPAHGPSASRRPQCTARPNPRRRCSYRSSPCSSPSAVPPSRSVRRSRRRSPAARRARSGDCGRHRRQRPGAGEPVGNLFGRSRLVRLSLELHRREILVRRSGRTPGIDIQFVGIPSTVAIVSSDANGVPNGGSVSRSPDGLFHVTMGGSNTGVACLWQFQDNVPFVIVLL